MSEFEDLLVDRITKAAEARGYERGRKEADQDAVDDAEANPEAPVPPPT